MLKHVYLTTVAALVAGCLSLISAPANAVTYADVYATGVTVKGDACKDATIDVYGDWVDADFTVTITDPNGDEFANDTFDDPNATGQLLLSITMCGADPRGEYTVDVEVYDNSDATTAYGSATFTLTKVKATSKAKSKIVTKRKYRAGKKFPWLVGGKLVRSGHAYSKQRVHLIAKIEGDWYKIDSAKTRKGVVAWQFKPNPTPWRFYFAGNGKTKPSVSKIFRTPRRGHGRVVTDVSPESLVRGVDRMVGGFASSERHLHVRG